MKANHSLELDTKLFENNLLICNHMMTDQLQHSKLCSQMTIIASQFTKAVSRLFLVWLTSRQLNAVPYLLVFVSLSNGMGGKDQAQACVLPAGDFTCVLVLLPDQLPLVFGLGMTLCVCMHTKLENGKLRNRQQLQCAVNILT